MVPTCMYAQFELWIFPDAQCLADHHKVSLRHHLMHRPSYSPGAHQQRRTGMVLSEDTRSMSQRSQLGKLRYLKRRRYSSQCNLCILTAPTIAVLQQEQQLDWVHLFTISELRCQKLVSCTAVVSYLQCGVQ